MKFHLSSVLLSATLLFAAAPGVAQAANGKKVSPPTESELIGQARAEYPLKTCLVSDEDLGSMGEAVPYVHRVAGQPDRVVFMCCEGCIDDFKAEPAKYLKKVDDARKNKPAPAPRGR